MTDRRKIPYDPGPLPTLEPPKPGESIRFTLGGLPPYKDLHFSIRNPRHRYYRRFEALRAKAIEAMAGRAPFRGAVGLNIKICAPSLERGKKMLDYIDGITDTLDGSHGVEFTYLPIVYEDDCQVAEIQGVVHCFEDAYYELTITFLEAQWASEQPASADR